VSNALSDELFNPLDLDELLEDAFEDGGLEAVVSVLADAVDDPRAAGDPALPGYLDELADHYAELERYADAVATAHRIIDLDPSQRVDELIWIAGLHARDGRPDQGRDILDRLRAELQSLPEADRDLLQSLSAATALADDLSEPAEAADWLADDIRTAMRVGAEPDLVKALDTHRRRVAALATPPIVDGRLDGEISEYVQTATPATTPPPQPRNRPRNQMRMGYLPPGEFAQAVAGGYHADTGHLAHRREIELSLRQTPPGSQRVVPITVDGLVAFAEQNALDPATPYARLRYAEALDTPGILWPPERNDPCWCGSGAKYKKCCRAL
jgi:hypothetical protein